MDKVKKEVEMEQYTFEYANKRGYSDVDPFEIVRRISEKTIEVREMDAEKDPRFKPEYVPGGFSAICTNQVRQKWIITSNPSNPVFKIRLHKDGWWRDADGSRYRLSDKPGKYYDYNF